MLPLDGVLLGLGDLDFDFEAVGFAVALVGAALGLLDAGLGEGAGVVAAAGALGVTLAEGVPAREGETEVSPPRWRQPGSAACHP